MKNTPNYVPSNAQNPARNNKRSFSSMAKSAQIEVQDAVFFPKNFFLFLLRSRAIKHLPNPVHYLFFQTM